MAVRRKVLQRSLAACYLCLWAGTWLLGWDPLSVSPHGPLQESLSCRREPASSRCAPQARADVLPSGLTPLPLMLPPQPPRANLLPKLPLVSAMTITKNGRAQMLDIALTCLRQQSYPSKEIVVVYDSDNEDGAAVVRRHAAAARAEGTVVKAVVNSAGTKTTLGELRNEAVAATKGALLIQWDDDDWYSPERIEMQYRALVSGGASGCLLLRYTLFESATDLLWLNRADEPAGSIMATRELFAATRYHKARLSEDSVLIMMAKQRNLKFVTLDDPSVYVRVIHAANSWDARHFRNFYK
eukprot:SAG22_NODE_1312_length_4776_cov_2.886466_7_plen_299_part_00